MGYQAGFGASGNSNSTNTGIGNRCMSAVTTGSSNSVLGAKAGQNITSASNSVCIGYEAGQMITTGNANIAIGYHTMKGGSGITGAGSIAIGNTAGYNMATSTANNTIIGETAGHSLTTGQNCLFLGHDAGITGSPGGNKTSGSSDVVLGDEYIEEANIQVDWTVASDKRDKTDVKDLGLGLEFINKLTPVTYKWDKRSKYIDKYDPGVDLNEVTTDGTHKEDWLDVGFLAQDVAEIEASYDYKIAEKTNLTTSLSHDGKQYGTQYSKFVPMLVKAVQELSQQVEDLKKKVG